ncbi:EAL domain-containing protein [Cupriavidus malaysiensis]|uniref:EAL domain-containing protein n=1 Tax=Cupriavidus malaysiensis TaxID=367825 RepID=A0ABM6FBM2_9BURK|nr:EAL domain-containing protein [Cupriavidus malaysiensis]AOZ09072.1 hypothetical protein BKK80_24875 [Cupriavidus malaysiensis]
MSAGKGYDGRHGASRAGMIEAGLARAMQLDELHLMFQPKFGTALGELTGAECLLRWRHPRLGNIPPDEFIPVAEAGGQIAPLTGWVIHEACRQLAAWRQAGFSPPPLAVNISLSHLSEGDLAGCLHEALARHGLAAASLMLEVTESTRIGASTHMKGLLGHLRAIGVGVAIDDFGTGYSNLLHLHELDVDQIKIDRVFISALESEDTRAHRLLLALIRLAKRLRIQVVAEGVENARQLRALALMGCDQVQGYYLSRPLSVAGFTELLARQRWLG